jgi:hypothetical protein
MSQDQPTLDPTQRKDLQEVTAPAGLWPRIEEVARASLDGASQVSGGGIRPEEQRRPILRFLRGDALRFAAAGLLGFFAFFGLQQVLLPELAPGARAANSASSLHFVEHLRDEIPLFDEQGGIIIPDADPSAWPEVILATYHTTTEVY